MDLAQPACGAINSSSEARSPSKSAQGDRGGTCEAVVQEPNYARLRRNMARTLEVVRIDRYERTLAPSSRRANSCANKPRTSASEAPLRLRNELIARSCLTASLSGSKSEFIEIPAST